MQSIAEETGYATLAMEGCDAILDLTFGLKKE
jgi:hypothetical protein